MTFVFNRNTNTIDKVRLVLLLFFYTFLTEILAVVEVKWKVEVLKYRRQNGNDLKNLEAITRKIQNKRVILKNDPWFIYVGC